MYYTGEHWDQYEDNFERYEEDIDINDDQEVQSLIESESEAQAAVAKAERTLTQGRQAAKDARATRRPMLPRISTAPSARESERETMFSVSWSSPALPDCPDQNKLRIERQYER